MICGDQQRKICQLLFSFLPSAWLSLPLSLTYRPLDTLPLFAFYAVLVFRVVIKFITVQRENPSNGCFRIPEAYILVRGVITIPYLGFHPRKRRLLPYLTLLPLRCTMLFHSYHTNEIGRRRFTPPLLLGVRRPLCRRG
eukprot:1467477-Pleurochrysis_carterae.AAC.1